METVLVSVSGPAFSFLLYENAKSTFDQEGFLLGEITEKETKSITDNDQEMVKLEKVIKVNCAIPCPHNSYFYDYVGKINTERIHSLLGEKTAEVIGWYKFRHSPGFKLTLREKVIHRQLTNFFNTTTPPDLFTTCLLTKELSDNRSTHLLSQTFVRYSNLIYQPLPMHIVNLSDPNNSYKEPEPISADFKQLLQAKNRDLKNARGVKIVGEIHNALLDEIGGVFGDLCKVYGEMFELEREIARLKHALNVKTESVEKQGAVENNNVVVDAVEGGGSGDVGQGVEGVPVAAKKKGGPGGGGRRAAKDETVKSQEKVIKTRSQANKVCNNNVSYAQAAQKPSV